jgi:transposase
MLPREYGSGSTCHRRFQQWVMLGVFRKVWTRLLKECDDKKGIRWTWQPLDSISIKSPLGGAMTGNSPVDRSKPGTKRHALADKKGIPLSAAITFANMHDTRAVTDVIDSAVVRKPVASLSTTKGMVERKKQYQHLCLDRAYASELVEQQIATRGYVPHMPCKRRAKIRGRQTKRNTLLQKTGDGLWKGQTRGTTGSGSCLLDMKRGQRTILAWCSCHAVSSFTER